MFDVLFTYPYLPFFVFLARICDVSLGTLRIIFISKGKKYLAPLFGFVEVFIWIIVISRILESSQNDIVCYIAYAAGYATGSFVGMLIEERLALGTQLIRIFTKKNGSELVGILNKYNYGATSVIGEGVTGNVHIIETVVNRKNSKQAEQLIALYDDKAFYVISDVRSVQHGIFPSAATNNTIRRWRQGK